MMLGSRASKNVFRVRSDDEASWRSRRPSTDRWYVVFHVDSIRSFDRTGRPGDSNATPRRGAPTNQDSFPFLSTREGVLRGPRFSRPGERRESLIIGRDSAFYTVPSLEGRYVDGQGGLSRERVGGGGRRSAKRFVRRSRSRALWRVDGRGFRTLFPCRLVGYDSLVCTLSRSNLFHVHPCTQRGKRNGEVPPNPRKTFRFIPRGTSAPWLRPATSCLLPREQSQPQTTPCCAKNGVGFVAPCRQSVGSSELSNELTPPTRLGQKPKAYSPPSQSQHRST
eukprot:scaffold2631_cov373-Pavlova_lutheri.AAC.5